MIISVLLNTRNNKTQDKPGLLKVVQIKFLRKNQIIQLSR
jgi:hypothetical protein